jgi:FkbM family methyltransferase
VQLDKAWRRNDSKLILYGAGEAGEFCYAYLEKAGLAPKVLFFVDGDENKQGKSKNGLEVCPPASVKKYPDAIIIIATMQYKSVSRRLRELHSKNSKYCWLDFHPRYNHEENFCADFAYIKGFYAEDDATEKTIREVIDCRTNPHYSPIRPYEEVSWLSTREYWYEEFTNLDKYPAVTIVDAGSYDGGNIVDWLNRYSREKVKKVYAIEPDLYNVEKLRDTIRQIEAGGDIVDVRFCGLGERAGTAGFTSNEMVSKTSDNTANQICVECLDDMKLAVTGRLCVKMDIEGAEIPALRGAEQTIKKYKPDLAICVYHRPGDIYNIPKLIKSFAPEYQCVIRGGHHMVCYASVDYRFL